MPIWSARKPFGAPPAEVAFGELGPDSGFTSPIRGKLIPLGRWRLRAVAAKPPRPGRTVTMEVRTVSELSARINRLEARVAEDRRVIASQQEAIGFQQAMLRELSDAYDIFESAV